MPTYLFTCEDCKQTTPAVASMLDLPLKVVCRTCGSEHTYHDIGAECRETRFGHAAWPIRSRALGCGKREVMKMRKVYADHGINVNVLANGEVEIPDRATRNKLMRFHGHYDMDAGYGDHSGSLPNVTMRDIE